MSSKKFCFLNPIILQRFPIILQRKNTKKRQQNVRCFTYIYYLIVIKESGTEILV
uniref:Uncharacterized protein n=1 Tax=Agarophyton chilense TaxID=2510777 RepID=O49036_AGACH|nr:ORF12 [Agarophyton chilense]